MNYKQFRETIEEIYDEMIKTEKQWEEHFRYYHIEYNNEIIMFCLGKDAGETWMNIQNYMDNVKDKEILGQYYK